MGKKKTKKFKKKLDYKPYFLHYFYCLAIIVLLTIASININNYLTSQKVLGESINANPLQEEKLYWQNIVSKNPSYIDGYLQIAKVDAELGDKNEAQIYINKALVLDPNNEKINEVQKLLGL